jgi:hypothetical protein
MSAATAMWRPSVATVWLLVATMAFGPAQGSAQSAKHQSKSGVLSPPRSVTPEALSLAAPMSDEDADEREARLGAHHRPVPMGPAPADLEERAHPAPPAQTSPRTAAPALWISKNRRLNDSETNNSTSTVSEPSVAARGREVLITGNCFAAFSRDGGETFAYLNPETAFPPSAHGRFCCDQGGSTRR